MGTLKTTVSKYKSESIHRMK